MSSTPDGTCAVVGTGCVLPGAFDVNLFWQNLLEGRTAVAPLADDAIHWSRHYSPDRSAPDRTHSLRAARILDYSFDWRRFRIPPLDAAAMNPMQLRVLDAGDQALRQLRRIPAETTGLFLGATGLGWQADSGLQIRFPALAEAVHEAGERVGVEASRREAVLARVEERLRQRLQPVSDDTVVNASASVALGRIAMHYDLRGPHYSIDAGFASGLAALDVAVRALRDGSVDLAVTGGVSELLTPLELVAFAKLGGMASERVAAFDAGADGTILGEGAVVFALKRLEDAVRDGETIYALVRGVGGSTDPCGKSILAPHPEGQRAALERAYADSGVDPATVRYVECHGTGTPLGDATEIGVLAEFFGGAGAPVALGSAKPFVGHLRGGAGAVGLLRAVLALHHGVLPGQINFRSPRPELESHRARLFVPTEPWALEPASAGSGVRAGVSAFGFGGNSFHAVLEAYSPGTIVPVRAPAGRSGSAEPIAVVGLGGIFPNASNVPEFWEALLEGRDTTREVPRERWNLDHHYDPDRSRRDTTYSRLGCFLDELVPPLDGRWRIPPTARESLDPTQLLMLRAVEEALTDARHSPGEWLPERVAVIYALLPYQGKKFLADIRVNFQEYAVEMERALGEAGLAEAGGREWLAATEEAFKAKLPPITEDTLPGYLGSIGAARIARVWNFRGPHFVVDSTCASSHAALHAAVQALRHRSADVVVSGGVWCDMSPEFYVAACRFNALSATGIRPFGDGADGFVPGEGAGAVVLQRLSDAEREGRPIHGLLRSVAGSSDGRGRSVLAPRPEGEALALSRALDQAGVAPELVDYVECHGTGTALGDEVEVGACLSAYGRGRGRPLRIGSVKSNIGHLNAAAGIPALIKALRSVREGVLPASLKASTPNPRIDFAAGPIEVVTETVRWEPPPGQPRRAGVSAFGIGGTNMHLIVEEYRPTRPGTGTSRASAIHTDPAPVLSILPAIGADLRDCVQRMAGPAARLRIGSPSDFEAALAEAQERASASVGEHRLAIVASTPEQLGQRFELLLSTLARGADPGILRRQGVFTARPTEAGGVALVFPGQGPQYAGMLHDAAFRFPSLDASLDRIDAVYEEFTGRKLRPAFFAPTPEPSAELADEDSHCATFAVSCAIFELLRSYGVRFDAVLGQSAGELSALVAAGALPMADGLRAMRERTRAVLDLPTGDPGRMVALRCPAERAARAIRELAVEAVVAADNSPSACLVSGPSGPVGLVAERLAAEGIEATPLAVSHAYHSPLISGARARYRQTLERLEFRVPDREVVSTITGRSIRALPTTRLPALLAEQLVKPVLLRQAVQELYRTGTRLFVECGPKWSLCTYIDDILAGQPHVAQATLHPKVGEVEQLHRALACLFVHGAATLAPHLPDTAPSTPPPAAT